ncbi:MAG TPA: PIN domain-containing protein [Streptosporangiaceae bacterium]|nr:PIN domain-containing protein [Streptosporangiaceae bacterium]
MTGAVPPVVVVDTMVISWLFDERPNLLADRYRELIGPARVLLAFQTVMELRYGALSAGWGELRRRRLERRIAELTVIQPDDAMVTACARLRATCQRAGHALGAKFHDGDRWIAAAAVRLDCPLVSHDTVFKSTPGLTVITSSES